MYEEYTRQSLPDSDYRELLGTAICAFNQNNAFVIENLLRKGCDGDWWALTNNTSGPIANKLKKAIGCDSNLSKLFAELVDERNRIVHSFQITYDGKQVLQTLDKDMNQSRITKERIIEFIENNGQLSAMLHDYRDSLKRDGL